MNAPSAPTCTRTDAVLATHLDGDPTVESGYDLASGESLHAHLDACAVCRRALHRARRLDAVLASTAGLALARHADDTGEAAHELADRLLRRAVAATHEPATPGRTTPGRTTPERTTTAADELSLPWTLFAAAGLVAAAVATWLLLFEPARAPAPPQVAGADAPRAHARGAGDRDPDETGRGAGPLRADVAAPGAPTRPPALADAPLPLDLARRLNRRAPAEQATLSTDQLAARVAAAARPLAQRLAAGRRLLDAAQASSPEGSAAFDALLEALAALGDARADELALQDDLLDRLRHTGALRARLTARLHDLAGAGRAGDPPLPRVDVAAVVVAARVGSPRLDTALRRALRRHEQLADVACAALRSAARQDGGAELLLQAWNDQVVLGAQQDSPRWAEFWFRGQSRQTFAQLPDHLERSRAAGDRVRCLLAMGCAGDDATVAVLSERLRSGNRAESHAALCALSSLPHHVLDALLPAARSRDGDLLRAALARAGLPAARPWLAELSPAQLALLRDAPADRFPEVAGWFRERPAIAD